MKKIIIWVWLPVLCACGGSPGSDDSSDKQYTVEGDRITVLEESPVLPYIKTQRVQTTDYRATFTASGAVQAIPSRYAEIAAPFSGRIVKSFIHLGQRVSPGSPVFEINSPSFFDAGKAYYQAKQEMEFALKSLNRERDLFANKVGVAKDVEEAEVTYELRKKDYENALAAVKVYQVAPDSMILGQPLVVRSPIAGEVVKDNMVIGQYIREDAGALAVVADLDRVRVTAYVKEKDIDLIREVSDMEIHLIALPDMPVKGTINYVSGLLDETTRSVEVIIECDNREHRMKPFMYGTVRFINTPARAIVIPNSAVLQREDNRYVWVSDGKNRFRRVIVKVASADESQTVVLSGIHDGDSIVTEGAFYFIDAR